MKHVSRGHTGVLVVTLGAGTILVENTLKRETFRRLLRLIVPFAQEHSRLGRRFLRLKITVMRSAALNRGRRR